MVAWKDWRLGHPCLPYTTPPMPINADLRDQLINYARQAMEHAYAPYSKFKVGAALVTTRGQISTGCNVENASYGLTICAERNAIFAAVTALPAGDKLSIQAIAVVNSQNVACSPCGACRQVIAEFAGKEGVTVFYQATDGIKQSSIADLLPDSFSL